MQTTRGERGIKMLVDLSLLARPVVGFQILLWHPTKSRNQTDRHHEYLESKFLSVHRMVIRMKMRYCLSRDYVEIVVGYIPIQPATSPERHDN